MRIHEYHLGDFVLRKNEPAFRDTFQRYRWRGPSRVLGADNTGHLVKIRVPASGRPDKYGRYQMKEQWINTSNVKPCRFDREGRLLSVQEFCLRHPSEGDSRTELLCLHCELSTKGGVACAQSQANINTLTERLQTDETPLQSGEGNFTSYNAMEIDGRFESRKVYNLTIDQYEKVMTSQDLEHYFESVQVEDVCPEYLADYPTPYGEFWDPLIKPGPEGPQFPSEILMTYFGVEDELYETLSD